jgi:hypothetical protein
MQVTSKPKWTDDCWEHWRRRFPLFAAFRCIGALSRSPRDQPASQDCSQSRDLVQAHPARENVSRRVLGSCLPGCLREAPAVSRSRPNCYLMPDTRIQAQQLFATSTQKTVERVLFRFQGGKKSSLSRRYRAQHDPVCHP